MTTTVTAADWQTCADPYALLELLPDDAGERRWRLFACGCCRRVWYMLRDRRSRRAVEVAERFADGAAAARELDEACRGALDTWQHWPRMDALAVKAIGAATWVAKPAVGLHEAATVLEYTLASEARLPPDEALLDRADLVRDVFGNPFRPAAVDPAWLAWNDGTVARLARAVHDEGAFDRLPVLADALEEAGCADPDILAHCRAAGAHVRGCWLLDLLLDRHRVPSS
jgi:hypothetical protein